jgi:hypothetical protein
MEDGFPLPDDWSIDLSSSRRSIVPSEEPVKTIFDGGENVYVKVSVSLTGGDGSLS